MRLSLAMLKKQMSLQQSTNTIYTKIDSAKSTRMTLKLEEKSVRGLYMSSLAVAIITTSNLIIRTLWNRFTLLKNIDVLDELSRLTTFVLFASSHKCSFRFCHSPRFL